MSLIALQIYDKGCDILIIDALIGFILALPNALLNSLSSISDITIPSGAFDWWANVINMLTYVFPVYALTPIFVISFSVTTFKLGWGVIDKLRQWLPFV